jgi:TRAP-type C4-dicarboxylate transport system substrate-binding protein
MMVGEQTAIGELWAWWLDEIEDRTDGELTFDRFWDATLLKSSETMQGLNDGRADIGQVLPTVYAGQFPLTSVGELPFETSNAAAIAQTLGTMGRDEGSALAKEWAGHSLIPLAWSVGASSALATNEPIEKASDLKGMRLRANDRGSRVLESIGVNLINIELAEIYGSMERGLVDGIYGIPFSFSGPLKYPEVADYFTDLGLGVSTVNGLAINQDTWSTLTEEQQQVITEVSAGVPAKIAEIEQRWEEDSCAAVKEAGDSVFVLPEEESAKIEAAGKEKVFDAWEQEVEGGGNDAQGFYDEYRTALEVAVADHPTFQTGVQRCAEAG